MPISPAALQVYDQYLTTYGSRRCSRYDTHDSKELKRLYSTIQLKNRFAPVYLRSPSASEITYAIHLKEQVKSLHETIDTLSCDDENQLFSNKIAYCDHPELVSVTYDSSGGQSVSSYNNVPSQFVISINDYAMPQRNTSSYLSAAQPVMMPAGSYSFDLITNKLHYELQFDLQPDDTHEALQQRLMRLINNSDLGVHAEVLRDEDRTALQITSDASGVPAKAQEHFRITDDNTSHLSGIVHYLGLNKTIEPARNASYSIDGQNYSSYRNTFEVYDAYEITLHPQDSPPEPSVNIQVGLYPDVQSMTHNIAAFVRSYNTFLANTRCESIESSRLNEDIHHLLALHQNGIGQYGIIVNPDDTLQYSENDELTQTPVSFDELQNFGSHLIGRLNTIALDPMEYVNRQICSYPNPATPYVNPYVTSIYSGMLFNTYC